MKAECDAILFEGLIAVAVVVGVISCVNVLCLFVVK